MIFSQWFVKRNVFIFTSLMLASCGIDLFPGILDDNATELTEQHSNSLTAEEIEAQKKQQVYALLSSKQSEQPHAFIIKDKEWQDFDLDRMVEKLDRTRTTFGSWGLRRLLNPIADCTEIARRQALIKTLVVNEPVRLQFVALLQEITSIEKELLAYWDEQDELNSASQSLYYSTAGSYTKKLDDYLNNNRFALENAALLDIGKNVASLGSALGTSGLLNEAMTAALSNRSFSLKRGVVDGLMQPIRMHTLQPRIHTKGYEEGRWAESIASGTLGDYYLNMREGANVPVSLAVFLTAAYVLATDVSMALNIRDSARRVRTVHQTHNALQARMTDIARFFKAVEQLQVCVKTHLPAFENQAIDQLLSSNEQISALCALLKTSTFDAPAQYFYFRGKVLLAHKTLQDNKEALVSILQMIAFIDAYVSMATLVDEHKDQKATFCFAEFVDNAKPAIACDDFWTPLMPGNQVVLNSIAWGADQQTSNIVLTGPNGVGKSTIMKALGACVILAQSFGIAPAKKAMLTPFTGVYTSFIQRENLQENISTFMAEKMRIDAIGSFVNSYHVGDRYLVLLDEPYRGTIESEAARLICVLGRQVAALPHTMLIMATHLEKPVSLAKETKAFANYQLQVTERDGRFAFTYKIAPGAADWWFMDTERRARFVDQLLINKGF